MAWGDPHMTPPGGNGSLAPLSVVDHIYRRSSSLAAMRHNSARISVTSCRGQQVIRSDRPFPWAVRTAVRQRPGHAAQPVQAYL